MKAPQKRADKETLEEIAEKVKARCAQREWDIFELAAISGVNWQTVRRLFLAESFPQIENWLRIVASLEVPMEDLMPDSYRQRFKKTGLVLLQGKAEGQPHGAVGLASAQSEGSEGLIESDANAHLLKLAKLPAEILQWDSLEAA